VADTPNLEGGITYDSGSGGLHIAAPGLYWVSYRVTFQTPTNAKGSVKMAGIELGESVTNGNVTTLPATPLITLEKEFEAVLPIGNLVLTITGNTVTSGQLANCAGASLAAVLLRPTTRYHNTDTGTWVEVPDSDPTEYIDPRLTEYEAEYSVAPEAEANGKQPFFRNLKEHRAVAAKSKIQQNQAQVYTTQLA
jgi:hypothetical protein